MNTPLRILHLEDNLNDAELTRATIEADGIECTMTRVDTREDFLAALERGEYDVILSDYSMPHFDGLSALEIAHKKWPHIPFILVSGTLGEDAAIESLRRGASDYLLKKSLGRLGTAIRRALEDTRLRKERAQAEILQRALYRIAETANSVQSLDDFFRSVHTIIKDVMPAENFYIALYDEANNLLSFPYFVDQYDEAGPPRALGRGLTEYVLRTGQSLLCDEKTHNELAQRGEIELIGTASPIWLGVPLRTDKKTFGVMVVQDYANEKAYGNREMEMLEFVSSQVAKVIDRKRTEQVLRESEYRLRSIIENEPECVKLVSADGTLLQINPAGLKMLEADSYDAVVGHSVYPFVATEHREAFRDMLVKVFRGENASLEFQIVGLKGTYRWMDMHAVPLRDDRGNIVAMLGITRDMTEKRQLEAQLLRTQRLESIGTLAGGIAHDLNNMLAPILLGVDALKNKITTPQEQKILTAIEASARRGADVVRQVLTFARGTEGEQTELDLKHLVGELVKIMKETFPRLIEISTEVPENIWKVMGDSTQLYQVLMNLCVNARDAMPRGGKLTIKAENITIDQHYVRFHVEAREGPHVVLTVSDTGTGIPPDMIDKIFDPFFTTKELGKGTGLGLSTVRGIVKNHGGFITVYSDVGKGTQFKMYLPVSEKADSKKLAAQRTAHLPTGNGELILVVDDEQSIRELVKNTLETFGYRVISADNGKEGLAIYQRSTEKISVILTDMMMPVMDGPTMIQAIRMFDPDVTIILSSGLGSGDPTRIHNVQATLQKPYTTEKLLATLHALLHQ